MNTSRGAKSVALAGMLVLMGACVEGATAPTAGFEKVVGGTRNVICCYTLTVAPTSVTLAAGATQQFTATISLNGVPDPLAVATWSVVAGGGTIDPVTGLFTAGATAGTFLATVQADGTGGPATADVIVTVAAPPVCDDDDDHGEHAKKGGHDDHDDDCDTDGDHKGKDKKKDKHDDHDDKGKGDKGGKKGDGHR